VTDFFLCTCNGTLPVKAEELQQSLGLKEPPHVFTNLGAYDVLQAKERLQENGAQRVVVGCCAPRAFFEESFDECGVDPQRLAVVDLKLDCYWPHAKPAEANAKAARLLKAAEVTTQTTTRPEARSVSAGRRVLFVVEPAHAEPINKALGSLVEPAFLFNADFPAPPMPPALLHDGETVIHRGALTAINGHLGEFSVTVVNQAPIDLDRCTRCAQCIPICHVNAITPDLQMDMKTCDKCGDCIDVCGHIQAINLSRAETTSLDTDQVVVARSRLNGSDALGLRRPGIHILEEITTETLGLMAGRLAELVGDFSKPKFVTYDENVCAAGSQGFEGCGICIPHCPYDSLERHEKTIRVDAVSCEGCGACTAACPTGALSFNDPAPAGIYARMRALLTPSTTNGTRLDTHPIIAFACGETGQRALRAAGEQASAYPFTVLPVPVPCLRTVTSAYILSAFRLGAAGVALVGCAECPNGKERRILEETLDFCKTTLSAFGLKLDETDRLQLITLEADKVEEVTEHLAAFDALLEPSPLTRDRASFYLGGNRDTIASTLAYFIEQTGREPGVVVKDKPYPFANIAVRESGCTLCRGCVFVCPTNALKMDVEANRLEFKYINCIACNLCVQACPETVMELEPVLRLDRAGLEYQTKCEDETVGCLLCGEPFITKRFLDTILLKVAGSHFFQDKGADLFRMCPDCRAVTAMTDPDIVDLVDK
jgi:ferredoxin